MVTGESQKGLMAEVQKQDPTAAQHDTEMFYMLVRMISTNALLAMGKIAPEGQQPPPPDLEAAAVFVDMLAMLEGKTEGKRSHTEDQIIKSALNQLQMVFIEIARQAGTAPPAGAAEQADAAAAQQPAAPQPAAPQAAPPPPSQPAAPSAPEAAKEEKVKYRKSYGAE
jgi:pyruvate/2-oxoglutarate dehydrogenase complex dihydrolipoamide acyltransferase (E2) component